jgi:DNA-binding transcriptional MerR regulator
LLRIGQLARRFGLNIRTLRYYEAIGLLAPSARGENGYRLYTEVEAERLHFILHAKQLGFSLKQIQYILTLAQRDQPYDFVRAALRQRLLEINEQITGLKQQRAELMATLRTWNESADAPGQLSSLLESGFIFPAAPDRADEP